jgi:hypothetical protein
VNRKLNQLFDLLLTGGGIVVVFAAVLLSRDVSLQYQVLMVVTGMLFFTAGMWGIAARLAPNERRFGALREEGDHMIDLIRQLNRAALARDRGEADDSQFNVVLKEMHDAVRLMAKLASLEDGQELPRSRKVEGKEESVARVA